MRSLACWLLMLTTGSLFAAPLAPGTYPSTLKSTWDGSEQPYDLFVPKSADGTKAMPLLVALHGKGATWESWFAGTPVRDWAEKEGYVVVAPHGRGDWFYLGPGERDVLDTIADVKSRCTIDEDRVFLVGHSMGGWGTWHFSASHPDMFAGVAPMSGWSAISLMGNLRHLDPFVAHGDKDEIVLPENSQAACTELTRLGISFRFRAMNGYGHESKLIGDVLPEVGDWFRGRERVRKPARVQFDCWTPSRGKAWWISVLALDEFLVKGTVDGSVTPQGVVQVETTGVRAFAFLPAEAPDLPAGPLKFRIDGSDVEVDGRPERLILVRDDLQWHVADSAPEPEKVVTLAEFPSDLPVRVATILSDDLGADVAVIPTDLVATSFHSLELTTDDFLDLYLRPETDRLARFEMPRMEFIQMMEKPDMLPWWWGKQTTSMALNDIPMNAIIGVVAPENVAARFPYPYTPLNVRLRKVVYDRVRSTGSF